MRKHPSFGVVSPVAIISNVIFSSASWSAASWDSHPPQTRSVSGAFGPPDVNNQTKRCLPSETSRAPAEAANISLTPVSADLIFVVVSDTPESVKFCRVTEICVRTSAVVTCADKLNQTVSCEANKATPILTSHSSVEPTVGSSHMALAT